MITDTITAAMIPKITITVNFIFGFMEHINTMTTPFHDKIICIINNNNARKAGTVSFFIGAGIYVLLTK